VLEIATQVSSCTNFFKTLRQRKTPFVSAPTPSQVTPHSIFPEIEMLTRGPSLVFLLFGHLFANPGRGLVDFTKESSFEDGDDEDVGDESASYDMVD